MFYTAWTYLYTCIRPVLMFIRSALTVALPLMLLYYAVSCAQSSFAGMVAAAIASLVVLIYAMRNRLTVASYGRAAVALSTFGAVVYALSQIPGLISQEQFLYILVGMSGLLAIAALWFDRYIFALCATVLLMAVPACMLGVYSATTIGWYCVAALGASVLLAYLGNWHLLALISFVLYLAYHPHIFALVSMTPKKGMLFFDDALWMLGIIGVLYTLVPWLYNLYNPRHHLIDAMCVVLAGAYTFASMRMIFRSQLRIIEQFKFLRIFTSSPKYIHLLMYLFFIYAAVYGALFLLGKILRRTSGLHTVIAMLALISFIGGVAVLNRTHKVIANVARTTTEWVKQVPLVRTVVTYNAQ